MATRNSATVLALVLCLLPGGIAPGQVPPPQGSRPQVKKGNLADLERRVAQLEKRVEALASEVQAQKLAAPAAAAPAAKSEVRIFALRNEEAPELARVLQQLFQGDRERKLRITAHAASNSVLVLGTREDLDMIEAVITRLDVQSGDKKPNKAQGKRKDG